MKKKPVPHTLLLKRFLYRNINQNSLIFTVLFLHNRPTDFEIFFDKFLFLWIFLLVLKKAILYFHYLVRKWPQ